MMILSYGMKTFPIGKACFNYSTYLFIRIQYTMSKHSEKIKNMADANNNLDKEWSKNRITPEKNEAEMMLKLKQLIPKQKKFSIFR